MSALGATTWRELEDRALQVEGEERVGRAAEVSELAASQYAEVRLVERLRASVGREVGLVLSDGSRVAGKVHEVGPDWVEIGEARRAVIPLRSLALVAGAAIEAFPLAAWGIGERLSLSSRLRRMADERAQVVVTLAGGAAQEGRVLRVGADFVELRSAAGSALLSVDRIVCIKC